MSFIHNISIQHQYGDVCMHLFDVHPACSTVMHFLRASQSFWVICLCLWGVLLLATGLRPNQLSMLDGQAPRECAEAWLHVAMVSTTWCFV